MAKTIVPTELRDLLNAKLKEKGWSSVRNFCLSTGLCTDDTYSAETITRVFNARNGETKGTELATIASILQYLDTPTSEIRELLEKYYPTIPGRMFWSLLGERETELTAVDRSFLEILHSVEGQKPEKVAGLIKTIEAYMMAVDVDCADIISRIQKSIRGRG